MNSDAIKNYTEKHEKIETLKIEGSKEKEIVVLMSGMYGDTYQLF